MSGQTTTEKTEKKPIAWTFSAFFEILRSRTAATANRANNEAANEPPTSNKSDSGKKSPGSRFLSFAASHPRHESKVDYSMDIDPHSH